VAKVNSKINLAVRGSREEIMSGIHEKSGIVVIKPLTEINDDIHKCFIGRHGLLQALYLKKGRNNFNLKNKKLCSVN